jgi:hypothetical protein
MATPTQMSCLLLLTVEEGFLSHISSPTMQYPKQAGNNCIHLHHHDGIWVTWGNDGNQHMK